MTKVQIENGKRAKYKSKHTRKEDPIEISKSDARQSKKKQQ